MCRCLEILGTPPEQSAACMKIGIFRWVCPNIIRLQWLVLGGCLQLQSEGVHTCCVPQMLWFAEQVHEQGCLQGRRAAGWQHTVLSWLSGWHRLLLAANLSPRQPELPPRLVQHAKHH